MDKSILLLEWYSGNFRSPESFFIYGGFLMKKYKTNEEFYKKAGFKYKPDVITGMYLWIKK